jgi:hypothetical protein
MTRSKITIVCLSVLLVATACSKPEENAATTPAASPTTQRITSESVVKVTVQPVELSADESSEAVVRLTIQNGYHVNANPPTFPYLKATTLEIPAAEGLTAATVTYPKAIEKQFAFADKPLAVYEGEVDLKATLSADKAAKSDRRSLPAHLRIQACDDQVCYPPGTVELTIPVNIK